jgi:XTP/dITP diphosphohydrolase
VFAVGHHRGSPGTGGYFPPGLAVEAVKVSFVTGNEGKVREAREYLDGLADVEQVDYDYAEVQAPELAPIAERGAREAAEHVGGPALVDDAGLFVDALDGFPGPYSAYVEDTLGIETIPDLVPDDDPGRARFRAVVAYCDGEDVYSFDGAVRGRIVAPRGDGGFGYDPVFEHDGATFAEMGAAEKNAISHRGRALAKFADWLADDPAERKGAR